MYCVFQNLLLPGCGHAVPLRPGLPGECTSPASVRLVHGCVWFFLSKGLKANVSPTHSPGTFWPWTAATGSASTSLTSRGTSRYVDQSLLLSHFKSHRECVGVLPAEPAVFVSQGRVVENISKRCGGFLRKLSLRGCLGVGDSALRWVGTLLKKNGGKKLSAASLVESNQNKSTFNLPSLQDFLAELQEHRVA